MKSIWLALATFAVLLSIRPAFADGKADQVEVKKLASEMVAKFREGDINLIMDHTHPGLAALMGGREKMEAEVKKGLEKVAAQGGKMLVYEVGEPEAPVASEGRTFVWIPTKMVLSISGKRVTVQSPMLAIRQKAGEQWYFLNLDSEASKAILEKIEPNLPAELKIPVLLAPIVEAIKPEEEARPAPEPKAAPKSE